VATYLNADPDHHIYSTDQIYDKIPGITRTDPRGFTTKLVKNIKSEQYFVNYYRHDGYIVD
jgi:hypothetical protein